MEEMAQRRKKKAKALMERTGILPLAKRSITQTSGGQLQRAGICRALMGDPEIIFADEPTGALNSSAAEEIMDIFSEINAQGTAVMMVTHDRKSPPGPAASYSWPTAGQQESCAFRRHPQMYLI